MELKDQIFEHLCRHTCDLSGYLPLGIHYLAEANNCSVYKARKCIRELKQEGLVVYDIYSGYDSYSCQNFRIYGYTVSLKGRETELYKKIDKEVLENIKKSFGLD